MNDYDTTLHPGHNEYHVNNYRSKCGIQHGASAHTEKRNIKDQK